MPRTRALVRFALFLLVAAAPLIYRGAAAQTGPFTYEPVFAGWNLLGFFPGPATELATPLYTWRPGAHNYDTPTTGVGSGAGYWAYFRDTTAYFLNINEAPSVSFTIPAGSCAMIGNPSHKASARVTGASRVYVYSNPLGRYVQENLLGIGRGAWACNDTAVSATVTVEDDGDVVTPDWPTCCAPEPTSNGGLARVVVHNDSPYPLIAVARQIDANGNSVPFKGPSPQNFIGVNAACTSCPEYDLAARSSCSPSATAKTFNLAPGTYTLHLQSEGPDVPDLQIPVAELDANTAYDACFFIDVNRPQKNY